MKRKLKNSTSRRWTVLDVALGKCSAVWLSLVLCVAVFGQTPATSPSGSAAPIQPDLALHVRQLGKRFFQDFAQDERRLWASPFRLRQPDWQWLLPLAATTTVLLATDRRMQPEFTAFTMDHPNVRTASRRVSRLGSPVVTFGLAGGIYAFGYLAREDRWRETGLLSAAALVHSSLVINVLKVATSRQRPEQGIGRGRFWAGGSSFPSGHAGTSFALAAVLAHQYKDKPLIRWGAYGVASAIAASRVTGLNHHPSDVVAGSALGYLIGRFVVREHAGRDSSSVITALFPYVEQNTNARGVRLMFSF